MIAVEKMYFYFNKLGAVNVFLSQTCLKLFSLLSLQENNNNKTLIAYLVPYFITIFIFLRVLNIFIVFIAMNNNEKQHKCNTSIKKKNYFSV